MLFEDQLVVKVKKGKYGPRGMPGDIIQLRNGDLLLSYTKDSIGLMGRKSKNMGKTWGEEFVILPHPGKPMKQGWYAHPTFLRLADGDLLMSYLYGAGAVPYYGHNYYRRSSDDGKTWSDQFVLTPYAGYVLMHNAKLLALPDGRIIAPVELKKRWPKSNDHRGYVSTAFYSDDLGYSWWMSENHVDVFPHEAQEPHVAQLDDARLLMMFRTYSGFMGRAYSADDGETWYDGEVLPELKAPPNATALTLHRIPRERCQDLLLIRNTTGDGKGRRNPLVSVISRDGGQTWENERVIAGDRTDDYGYQSVTFIEDMAVMSYHARDGLHVARIAIDWFYGDGNAS